jgi:hypothetical protein
MEAHTIPHKWRHGWLARLLVRALTAGLVPEFLRADSPKGGSARVWGGGTSIMTALSWIWLRPPVPTPVPVTPLRQVQAGRAWIRRRRNRSRVQRW